MRTSNKLPIVIALLAACGTTNSSSLLTTGISADMSASAPGDGTTHVSAELFDGSPDELIFVNLQSGDELVASVDSQSMPLVESQLLTLIAYDAVFTTDNEGDEFTIDFQRTVDQGAPASTATLPAPFTLDPVADTSSRAAAITVTYGPSGTSDAMRWQATGDCIQEAGGALDSDSGSLTIASGTLAAVSGSASVTCMVTLTVARDRSGTLDSHFGEGGEIQGEQARSAMFSSTP